MPCPLLAKPPCDVMKRRLPAPLGVTTGVPLLGRPSRAAGLPARQPPAAPASMPTPSTLRPLVWQRGWSMKSSSGPTLIGSRVRCSAHCIHLQRQQPIPHQKPTPLDGLSHTGAGGKLPGLNGGHIGMSGGRHSDSGFSVRLMWRRNGDGVSWRDSRGAPGSWPCRRREAAPTGVCASLAQTCLGNNCCFSPT